MIHHYITKYYENGTQYAEAWLQLDLFKWCWCFSRRKIEIKKRGPNASQTSNIKVPLHVNCRAFAEAVNNVVKKPGTEDDNLLLKMSEPIQKWLRQNKNPYVKVVIGDSGVEVISTEQWIPYKD